MVSTRSSSYSLSSSSSSSSSAVHGVTSKLKKRTTNTTTATSTTPIYTQSAKDAAIRTYKILHSTFPKINQNTAVTASAALSTTATSTATNNKSSQHPPPLRRSNRIRRIVNYNEDFADVSTPVSSSSKKTEVTFAQPPLPPRNNDYSESVDDESECNYSVDEAANILANVSSSFCDPCINPITPCFHYMYRFQITDPECKQHYTTCYILYDETSRRFHIHNKNTLIAVKQTFTEESAATSSRSACIQPSLNYASPREHSFLTKYITFMVDCVEKYIHNILIHDSVPVLITSMFFGIVISDNSKYRKLFDTDTTFYDIDALNHSTTSTQTTTGHEMFMLTPPTYYTKDMFNGQYIHDVCSLISGQAF